jgi:PIN domain nuclease of toxin-antitoxin system
MAIKSSIQKLKLPLPVKEYVLTRTQAHNINLLDITLDHIDVVEALPLHHRDPFDRLLIAQGIFENLHILTDDSAFDLYSIPKLW